MCPTPQVAPQKPRAKPGPLPPRGVPHPTTDGPPSPPQPTGDGVEVVVLNRVLRPLEHVQHALRDGEPAPDVDRGDEDRARGQPLRRVVGDEAAAGEDHAALRFGGWGGGADEWGSAAASRGWAGGAFGASERVGRGKGCLKAKRRATQGPNQCRVRCPTGVPTLPPNARKRGFPRPAAPAPCPAAPPRSPPRRAAHRRR